MTSRTGKDSRGPTPDHLDRSLYRYILRHTRKDQIFLILMTLASMPLVYYSLEVPKLIINKAIGAGSSVIEVAGYQVTQIQYLLILSVLFLALVILNGVMKYIINVYRGVLGERMLRRFRYTLYSRILRFPTPHLKHISSSEIIPMVTAETEPLGGFIGDSIALPAFQGGLLITYLSFIFVQDFWLGIAAIALYPPQAYLIPKLQRQVNELSKERIQNVRQLADRIGETVNGVPDIRINDTGYLERAEISKRLGTIFVIRKSIFKRKFFIKFLNNFLAQLTPFFFYSIGGYLVLQNKLSLGALVAVLAAYKDISPPWKELLKFYQITEDVRVKYAQILEQFAPDNMHDYDLHTRRQDDAAGLHGPLAARNLHYSEDGVELVDNFNFEIGQGEHIAVISRDGSASHELAQLVASLLPPGSGSISLNAQSLKAMPDSVLGRKIGYCSTDSRLFNSSIRDNLYYGLKHQPQKTGAEDTISEAERSYYLREAQASGNSPLVFSDNWIDIHQSGAATKEEFEQIVHEIIECVELDDELLTLALRTTDKLPIPVELADKIVTLRDQLRQQINQIESNDVIEPLDPEHYIENLTVEDNLLFGSPLNEVPATEFLDTDPFCRELLQRSGLEQQFTEIGLELARLMVELFSDVPDDSELFEQFSFIRAGDLDLYQALIAETESSGLEGMKPKSRRKLSALSYKLCPARHRLGLIAGDIQDNIVAARKELMAHFGNDNRQIQFFDMETYNPGMSVQENLLFGKIIYTKGHLQPRVTEMIKQILKQIDMDRSIVVAGLDCQTGTGGSRLSPGVRQKLVLARALLKNPELLVVDNILGGMDSTSARRILDRVLERCKNLTVVWVLNDTAALDRFRQVLVIEKSKQIYCGSQESIPETIALP